MLKACGVACGGCGAPWHRPVGLHQKFTQHVLVFRCVSPPPHTHTSAPCSAGLLPSSAQQDAAEAGTDEEAAEREQFLQQLQEEVQQLVDERQDELRAAYQQLGMPLPDLSLNGSGDDGGSSGSSRQQKQLTGR